MPNTCYMLYILAFTHIFLSFQMLHEIDVVLALYQRCSFRQTGQCEGLNSVGRAADWLRALFVSVRF